MTGPEGVDNCQKFVDILGLRSIFPLFMKTPKKHRKIGSTDQDLEGEYAVYVVISMFVQGSHSHGKSGKVMEKFVVMENYKSMKSHGKVKS